MIYVLGGIENSGYNASGSLAAAAAISGFDKSLAETMNVTISHGSAPTETASGAASVQARFSSVQTNVRYRGPS